MKKIIILLFLVSIFVQSSVVSASDEREDIKACMKKVKEFANISVDPFDAKYESHWTSPDIVRWKNVYCDTSFDRVHNLQVSGTEYIVQSYAGEKALSLSKKLKEKIKKEKDRLEIQLEKALEALRHKDPDLKEIEKFIDNGILDTSKCSNQDDIN